MDFGALNNINGVDFSLPGDSPRSARLLANIRGGERRVFIGAPVWTCPGWVGKVFPEGTPAKDFLKIYSRQFNSIELNATHYRVPTEETVARWREDTPEGFKFFPKFPQEITHRRMLEGCDQLAREFCERMKGLGSRLGALIVQLPPGFVPAKIGRLAAFLAALPKDVRIAVEFRHAGWFTKERELIVPAVAMLEQARAIAVMTDVSGRRDVLHSSITSNGVLVRFQGNMLHPTDFERLDAWAERLRTWLDAGLRGVAFFLHQPDEVAVPEIASHFIEKFNLASGMEIPNLKPPASPEKPESSQLSLID